MKTIILTFVVLVSLTITSVAQVGIGTNTPDANAILDVSSGTKGLLVPRMTNANRPVNIQGMLLYQTDATPGIYMNSGSAYSRLIGGTGTTNYIPKFTSSGDLQSSLIFDNGTNVGIGTTNPLYKLDISGGAVNSTTGFYENGVKISNVSNWTLSGSNIYNNNTGYVGIGTAAPTAKLAIYHSAATSPVPLTCLVTSSWNVNSTDAYSGVGLQNISTAVLDNTHGTNPDSFIGFYSKHTTSGASAGNMQVATTRTGYLWNSFASNGDAVVQKGLEIRSTLDNASGNIISNFCLDIITGNTLVSANPNQDLGVINNNYGIRISRPIITGTIFYNYGLYIAAQNAVGDVASYPIFYNAPSGDAYLTAGGVWTNACDSTGKANIIPVNTAEILDKIAQLPVSFWNYKCEKEIYKHISPMAQDFQSIFNVGYLDNTITTIDPAGVALAGIQELVKRNDELKQTVESQQRSIGELQETNLNIIKRLQELENQILAGK